MGPKNHQMTPSISILLNCPKKVQQIVTALLNDSTIDPERFDNEAIVETSDNGHLTVVETLNLS